MEAAPHPPPDSTPRSRSSPPGRSEPPPPRASSRFGSWLEQPRNLPFTTPVAAIVVLCGLLAVFAVATIGVSQLAQQSDREAALQSRLLALTLVERLGTTEASQRRNVVERAAVRSGAELLLVDDTGHVVIDGSVRAPSAIGVVQLLRTGQGETHTSLGRVRFYAARLPTPLDHLSLLSLVPAPDHPLLTDSLIELLGAFTFVLLGIAALVAYALAKGAQSEIAYVETRIEGMATLSQASGTTIPVRSLDQVGAMTETFNELVQRYAEAESAYKTDLDMAVHIERDKSAFLAALSHEFRTPLNAILGFTDVLLGDMEGPLSSEARENLEMVRRSGTTLTALIRDILDLSALESGELTLSKTLTDVFQVAEDVVKQLRVRALEKGLRLELLGEHAKAWADPLRVRQMIDNLAGNAVKFTHSGRVTVLIEARGEQTAVIVEDTGPGIASVEQTTVFDDYAQFGDSAARGAGSGLGLAITRRLVRMHDGSISLQSALGEGATFTILLPSEPKGEATARKSLSDADTDLDAGGTA